MVRVTNVNEGGTVGIQSGSDTHDEDDTVTVVTNVNEGGTVGIQGGNVSGNTVIIGW